jgi:ABC-2 type transport system ATP-binding protein
MLEVRGFKKQYNQHLILQFDELKLSNGVYWFKGENGSGKSTLFKSLAGLLPFDGDVILNNIDLKKKPLEYRKHVNYSEAEPSYPGFVTAKDLTRFVGKTKDATQQQQEYYSTLFAIDSYFEQTCETFSSGMLKKLSLSLAFLGAPDVIILDEPLITLDEHARKILLDHIKTLSSEKIFLLSSHQLLDNNEITVNQIFRIENQSLLID